MKKNNIGCSEGFSVGDLLGDLEDSDTVMLQQDLVTNSLEGAEEPEEEPFTGKTEDLILQNQKEGSQQEKSLDTGFYILDLKTKAVYAVMKERVIVGSSSECDIVVENALLPHTVSRKHAIIEIEGETAYITDTSSNGIFLAKIEGNDVTFHRIPKGTRTELLDQCIFKLAKKSFKFIAPKG